jgi:hypothetical protein
MAVADRPFNSDEDAQSCDETNYFETNTIQILTLGQVVRLFEKHFFPTSPNMHKNSFLPCFIFCTSNEQYLYIKIYNPLFKPED